MNRKWSITLATAIAAGLVAYGVTVNIVCGSPASSLDRLHDVSFLTGELRLSDTQIREIEKLHATLVTRLGDACVRHCRARARLGQALADEIDGDAKAEAIVAEMCRAYEEGERTTLDHIRQLRDTLDAEQRRQFDALIRSCLCQPCGCSGNASSGKVQRP